MKRSILSVLGVFLALAFLVSCENNESPESPICEIVVASDGEGAVAIANNTGLAVTILKGNSLEVVATPDDGYEFIGWFVGDDATPVSTEAAYTFVVSRSVVLVAKFRFPFAATGSVGGHEFVDLGLPSGLKWATCNVGATEIYGRGGHYAWGETEVKSNYTTWENYRLCDGTDEYMTRYNGHDGNKILGLSDDAAYCEWGDSWRMPTQAEMQELCENCTFESVKVEGVLGLKVKGPNGRCIFLPAASYRGSTGNVLLGWLCYWTSSVFTDSYPNAYCLYLNVYRTGQTYNPSATNKSLRRLGYSIRPVVR
jgi:hypothetical protein